MRRGLLSWRYGPSSTITTTFSRVSVQLSEAITSGGGPWSRGCDSRDGTSGQVRHLASVVPLWKRSSAKDTRRDGQLRAEAMPKLNHHHDHEPPGSENNATAAMEQLREELHKLRFEISALRAQAAVTRSEFSRALDNLGAVQSDLLSSAGARGLVSRRPFVACRTLPELCDAAKRAAGPGAASSILSDAELTEFMWRYVELAAADPKEASQPRAKKSRQEGADRARQLAITLLNRFCRHGKRISAPAAGSILSALSVLRWNPGAAVLEAAVGAAVAEPPAGASSAAPLGPSSTAEVATALSRLRHYSPEAMDRAASRLLPWVGAALDCSLVASAAAAFATFQHPAPALAREIVLSLQPDDSSGSGRSSRMKDLSVNDTAMVLWALAVLGELPEALFQAGFVHLRDSVNSAPLNDLDADHQRKFYQAFLLVCAGMEADGRSAAALRREVLGSEVGQALREAWVAPDPFRINTSKGALFSDVREALEGLQVPFEAGVHVGDLEIDFLLKTPTSSGVPVVLQVVGPNQITSTRPRRVLGYVEAYRQLLEVQGFDPVQLTFFEVKFRKGSMQEFLHSKLESKLGWPEYEEPKSEGSKRRGRESKKKREEQVLKDEEGKESMGAGMTAEVVLEGTGPGGGTEESERDTAANVRGVAAMAATDIEGGEDEAAEFDMLLAGLRAKDDGEQAAREVFPEWRVAELRKLLRHLKLPVSGSKAVLVERIVSAVFHKADDEGCHSQLSSDGCQ